MTQKDPKKRPTIQEAIEQFNKTRESLGLLVPRKPLHAVDDTRHRRWANDILAILLDAKFFAARAVSRVNPLRMFAKYVMQRRNGVGNLLISVADMQEAPQLII